MLFNEDKLQEEIIKTWGEFGVHNEVFNAMRKQLLIHNVVVPKGTLCDNLDASNNCKNMCLTRCIDGNEFWK